MTEIITQTISRPEVLKAKGVEVLVRCRDCKFYVPADPPKVPEAACLMLSLKEYSNLFDYWIVYPKSVSLDDYCVWGELQ